MSELRSADLPRRGETDRHRDLKSLAIDWARNEGFSISAPEVSFPHRKFRVDVAACLPLRKAPRRKPVFALTSALRAAAIFECKQARADLICDNQRRELVRQRLVTLENRRTRLENLLQLHLPHLANGDSLFPEFDSYRLREHRHEGYEKLVRNIAAARRGLTDCTKFDRLYEYRMANLHYLVVENDLMEAHEAPVGWGLLIREGDILRQVAKPTWQEITVEHQLIFLQRIAACKTPQSARRITNLELRPPFTCGR